MNVLFLINVLIIWKSYTNTCILNTFIIFQYEVSTRSFCEFLGHSWQENWNMSLLENGSYVVFVLLVTCFSYSSTCRTDEVGSTSLRNVGIHSIIIHKQYSLKTCLTVKLCGHVKLCHSWCNANVSIFIFQPGANAKLSNNSPVKVCRNMETITQYYKLRS
jgi:hypothetical protein